MKKAYLDLLDWAIEHDWSVSVWDEEEWQVKKSRNMEEILAAVHSVECPELRFVNTHGVYIGTATVIWGCGMQPEETVADWSYPTDHPDEMDIWHEDYKRREDV